MKRILPIFFAVFCLFSITNTVNAQRVVDDVDMEVLPEDVELNDALLELDLILFPERPKFKIDKELQYWLYEDDMAPFDGLLLNPEATAHILSEYAAQRRRGQAAIRKQMEADNNIMKRNIAKLKLDLETQEKKFNVERRASENENKRLLKINEDLRENQGSNIFEDVLKIGGGIGLGILIGVIAL